MYWMMMVMVKHIVSRRKIILVSMRKERGFVKVEKQTLEWRTEVAAS
jgi:hypothetical protein